jgi:hypothetical protein
LQAAVKGHTADKISIGVFYSVLFNTYALAEAQVLEAFARDGAITVSSYVPFLKNPKKQLECWELNPDHEYRLLQYTDKVKIVESYQFMLDAIIQGRSWDLIIIDIPQGLHSSSDREIHAEHFDFLPLALRALNDEGVVVFNLNRKPYNRDEKGSHGYDEYAEYNYQTWMQKREQFYGCVSHREEVLLGVYRQLAYDAGYVVKSFTVVPALPNVDGMEIYTSTVAMHLSRTS